MFNISRIKKQSAGAFNWTYDLNSVSTIQMKAAATLSPTFVTRTVSLHDDVSLTVTRKTQDDKISNIKWRKNGGEVIKTGTLQFDITNASSNDNGIYECHFLHQRGQGNQALMRLVVRGCPKNKYSPPDCSTTCPRCLNGGVCDDVGGECICPPGFGGQRCGRIKRPNTFGQKGSLRCNAVGLPSTDSTCRGMLFCLPDPYGCSCAAGYQGLECNTDCNDGTYGANCAQICHCAEGASCDGTTGRCNGDCAAGYKGVNCQVQCTAGKFGKNCTKTCNCADGIVCNGTTGECHGDCATGYIGNNCQEQCLHFDNKRSCNTTCTALDPDMEPKRFSVSSYSANDSFTHTLSWEPVICPAKGFSIVNYVYKVLDGRGSEVEPVEIEGISVNLNLNHCTRYQLEVAAQTSKGIGNYSMVPYLTTKSNVPNPVTNVTILDITDTQLSLSWLAFVTDKQSPCPAIDYMVTYDLIHIEQCQMVNRRIDTLYTTSTSITIDRLEAYSTYMVNITSRNQVGSAFITGTITTKPSRPEAPTVTVASTSKDYIEFAWELPCGKTGGHITEYEYRYRTEHEKDFIQPIATANKLIRITSLTPCTSYIFQVRAWNSIGKGPWSNETWQETNKQEPLGVKNVQIEADSQGRLVVFWENRDVNHNNPCFATGYFVTYELINLEQCQEVDHVGVSSLNTSDTTITVDGLHPYSTYRINVTSSNEAGDGPTKSKSAITTERSLGVAPTLNSSRVTSSSIYITWNPIPCGSRGGSIIGYNVILSPQSQASKPVQVPNTHAQFDNLSPCTSYTINVTTISTGGTTSFNQQETTESVAPEAVTDFTISRKRHDQLRVSWTAPGTNSGNPCLASSYLVTYELINLEQCQEVDNAGISSLNTSDTSVLIEGLKAHSKYRVSVIARNEAGDGTATTKSKITGERSPQAAPTFNEREVTASSISITWNPIPCGSRGGNIAGYRAELHLTGYVTGHAQHTQSVDVRGTSVRFVNLSPCTSYTIAVTTLGTSEGTSFEQEETTYTVAPGRVTMLRANPTSDATQIHVVWQNPNANNCPVSKYTVEYQLTNRDQCDSEVSQNREQWLDGSQSPTTIAGLYPHSTYIVYVTPSNSAGAGGKESAMVITNDTAPSGPPRDVESTDITNQTIAFSWKQPACGQRNGIITQHHCRLIDSEKGVFEEDTTSSTGVEFTGLVPFTSYTLSVSAENQFGSGPVASYTTQTEEGIPPPPSKVTFPVTRSDRITVAWNAPSPPHGIIISYEIRYWKTGSGNQTLGDTIRITKQLASRYQTKTIMALDKSTSYSIQIRAETSVGHGPWSDISTVTTVPKVPTPPSNVTFPVIRSDRITVSWLRPSQGDSINYEIRYWRTGSGNSSSAEIVRVKDNQQTDLQTREITNLEGNVSYSFQVWCQVNHRYVLKHILDLEDGSTSHYL
ncbi:protein sidekick-2-like [Asterias amurensis]|uniref:protein sidekick-2-like n=1 Tax=Asterias amurensis TaxID=7602 RepID=UPI003AB53046